jgi:hypothetical protein
VIVLVQLIVLVQRVYRNRAVVWKAFLYGIDYQFICDPAFFSRCFGRPTLALNTFLCLKTTS